MQLRAYLPLTFWSPCNGFGPIDVWPVNARIPSDMKLSTFRTGWVSLLLVSLLACDRIGQDVAPTDADIDDTERFALPDNKVAIDLTTLANLKSAATFSIARQPQSGTVSFAANGLLLYQPNTDFVAGDDDFSVSATQSGVPLSVPVLVKMAADDEAVPCEGGALPDRVDTPTGQPVKVAVLKNDRVCDGAIDPATLRVVVKPKFGTVRIDGDAVIYTPTSGTVSGRDEFIYKICSDGGSRATCYMAPVVVVVGSPGRDCQVALHDDRVIYRHLFVTDSLIIPVLANDQLCQGSRSLPVTITRVPTKGTAYTLTRSSVQTIVYKPGVMAEGADNLMYQRCVNGNCQQAVVRLQARAIDPTCQLLAKNDQRTVSLLTDLDAKAGRLLIPVLLNDKICSPIATMRILDNPSTLNLRIRNGVIIYTLGNAPKKGTFAFTYELADSRNNRVSARVKVTLNE